MGFPVFVVPCNIGSLLGVTNKEIYEWITDADAAVSDGCTIYATANECVNLPETGTDRRGMIVSFRAIYTGVVDVRLQFYSNSILPSPGLWFRVFFNGWKGWIQIK